jgi:hypothetical protein
VVALEKAEKSRLIGGRSRLNPVSFLKYSFLTLVAQLLSCAFIWIAVLIWSPALDSLFEKMVFFYWPTIILVAKVLGASGESAMIAVPIYGMALGMLLYGSIIGLLVSYLKTRTR